MISLVPILIFNWYFTAVVNDGFPSYVFFDDNSRLIFRLSSNRGGVDDIAADDGTAAIAWWDIWKGRKHCHVSLIGRDFREFSRFELGECGSARMGIDLKGNFLAVIHPRPDIIGGECVVNAWKEKTKIYEKIVGKCDGGDVFLKENGEIEYVLVKGGRIEASWGKVMECERVVYRGRWVECDGKRLSW